MHERFGAKVKSEDGLAPNLDAYIHFRADAYLLLTHYVDHGLREAFRWLLLMNDAAPQRTRIPLQDNPFHWGLLAITAAARSASRGARRWRPFMSLNKLRDLGSIMKRAHAAGVGVGGLEEFIIDQRKREHHEALSQKLHAIRQDNPRVELVQTPQLTRLPSS
jgi:hypothetical protein